MHAYVHLGHPALDTEVVHLFLETMQGNTVQDSKQTRVTQPHKLLQLGLILL